MSCRFCGIICKDSEKACLKCENVHTASKFRTKYYIMPQMIKMKFGHRLAG